MRGEKRREEGVGMSGHDEHQELEKRLGELEEKIKGVDGKVKKVDERVAVIKERQDNLLERISSAVGHFLGIGKKKGGDDGK